MNTHATPAADYSLTPTQLIPVLCAFVEDNLPCMLWSPPGVGKSAALQEVARITERIFIDIRALLKDPVDMIGLPFVDQENFLTRWARPDMWPAPDSTDKYLIALEEITAAPPAMQASMYQLVWDRKLGEYELPAGAAVMAAGNRVSDRGVAVQMPTPLARRFHHFDVATDAAEWLEWAMANDLHEDVIFFMHMRPDLLHQFNPKSKDHTGPNPRTWEMASRVLKVTDKALLGPVAERAALRGTVGEGAAIELCAFRDVKQDLVMPETVISSPETAPTFDDKPSSLLALCGALYRKAEDTNFDAIGAYAARIRPEVGEFLMGSCIKRNPELQTTRANVDWIARNNT